MESNKRIVQDEETGEVKVMEMNPIPICIHHDKMMDELVGVLGRRIWVCDNCIAEGRHL